MSCAVRAEPCCRDEVLLIRRRFATERGESGDQHDLDMPPGLDLRQPGHFGGLGPCRCHNLVDGSGVVGHGLQDLGQQPVLRHEHPFVAGPQPGGRALTTGPYRPYPSGCLSVSD